MFDACAQMGGLLAMALGDGPRRPGWDRFGTRVQEQDQEEQDQGGEDEPDPGDSALGRLLRHPSPVPRGEGTNNGGPTTSWLDNNRVWFVPWVSALLVVAIEITAALFAPRPIPVEGHAVLGAFWVFAVGRGSARLVRRRAHAQRLASYAERRGLPPEVAQNEWRVFQADVERTPLPPGRDPR